MKRKEILQKTDVIVVGAGAAGMMCAIEAGRRGRRVIVLDHAERVGKKILISGGGRCNFTNIHCRPESFLSANPHFAKSALARYTPADFIALVVKHEISYHEKTLGQLFCDRSSQQIVSMLEKECGDAGVKLKTSASVKSVRREEGFFVETSLGAFQAEALVIASGGLSIPKMGATGFGYDIARQFGLKIVETRPGLVPLVLGSKDAEQWCDLTGVSVMSSAKAEPTAPTVAVKKAPAFREKLLITHRGLSGPAILQASSYWRPGGTIEVDLAPGLEVFTLILAAKARRDRAAAHTALRNVFPARLAERWLQLHLEESGDPSSPLSNTTISELERLLHKWVVTPAGTEGYAKAEVTAGGVDTAELDARTMESKRVPRLYFIGEVVDVTGWLGGYNFQWAWASGAAAGRAV